MSYHFQNLKLIEYTQLINNVKLEEQKLMINQHQGKTIQGGIQ